MLGEFKEELCNVVRFVCLNEDIKINEKIIEQFCDELLESSKHELFKRERLLDEMDKEIESALHVAKTINPRRYDQYIARVDNGFNITDSAVIIDYTTVSWLTDRLDKSDIKESTQWLCFHIDELITNSRITEAIKNGR